MQQKLNCERIHKYNIKWLYLVINKGQFWVCQRIIIIVNSSLEIIKISLLKERKSNKQSERHKNWLDYRWEVNWESYLDKGDCMAGASLCISLYICTLCVPHPYYDRASCRYVHSLTSSYRATCNHLQESVWLSVCLWVIVSLWLHLMFI